VDCIGNLVSIWHEDMCDVSEMKDQVLGKKSVLRGFLTKMNFTGKRQACFGKAILPVYVPRQ